MKRSKFGLGLLLTLLLLGMVSTWAMNRSIKPIAETVRQAGTAGFRMDWEIATEKMGEAKTQWEKRYPLCASLTDHEPMEELDSLFAQGEVCLRLGAGEELGLVCAQLVRQIRAMGDAHACTWWNLL